jgi:hypothetical protein
MKEHVFIPRYELGDIVYLRTDEEQLPRMVTGWIIRAASGPRYELTQGLLVSQHQELELSREKELSFALGYAMN